MSITNTIAIYLIFLAYINFTKFENLIKYCCCRPRLTSLFPIKARQQAGPPREDSQRWLPLFFFFFIFSLGPCFFFFFFFSFCFLRGGGGGLFFSLFFFFFFFVGGGG